MKVKAAFSKKISTKVNLGHFLRCHFIFEHDQSSGINYIKDFRISTLSWEQSRPEYQYRISGNIWQKTFHPTKTASVLSAMNKTFFVISYQHFKTHEHLVSIDFSSSAFSFYDHFNRQFTYAVSLLFKAARCVWVKRFCSSKLPPWKHFICHYTVL